MFNEGTWKWWISSFAIPLAMFLATAGALFVAYLQYDKDVNEIRVKVEKDFKETVEKLNGAIAKRDLIIEKQKNELETLSKKAAPGPASPPKFDYSKYWYLFSEPAKPKSLAEQFFGFLNDNWKTLALLAVFWAVMVIASLLSES